MDIVKNTISAELEIASVLFDDFDKFINGKDKDRSSVTCLGTMSAMCSTLNEYIEDGTVIKSIRESIREGLVAVKDIFN